MPASEGPRESPKYNQTLKSRTTRVLNRVKSVAIAQSPGADETPLRARIA